MARPTYELRLYVTGTSRRSTQSVAAIKAKCEGYLQQQHSLQAIDAYPHPQLAGGDRIVAAPTLIKRRPKPSRRLVGDLSNREHVGLDLRPSELE